MGLLRLAWHYPDWEYVQDLCLSLLEHPDQFVRTGASWGIRTLAQPRKNLRARVVLPVLRRLVGGGDPDVAEALDAVEHYVFFGKFHALQDRPLDAVYLGALWSIVDGSSNRSDLEYYVDLIYGSKEDAGADVDRQVARDLVLRRVVEVRRTLPDGGEEVVPSAEALVALDDRVGWEEDYPDTGELLLYGTEESRSFGQAIGLSAEMDVIEALHDRFPLIEDSSKEP